MDHVPPTFEVICLFYFLVEHGHLSYFDGTWSLCQILVEHGHLKKKLWSMVVSQILVEHGRFSNLGGAWSFLKLHPTLKMNMFNQNLRSFVIFIFWWSMVVFSNFCGTWSFSLFGGAWSFSF